MKKIIITVSGLLFAASLFIGISIFNNVDYANNLLLANIEALAAGGGEFPPNTVCFSDVEITSGGANQGVVCGKDGGQCSWESFNFNVPNAHHCN